MCFLRSVYLCIHVYMCVYVYVFWSILISALWSFVLTSCWNIRMHFVPINCDAKVTSFFKKLAFILTHVEFLFIHLDTSSHWRAILKTVLLPGTSSGVLWRFTDLALCAWWGAVMKGFRLLQKRRLQIDRSSKLVILMNMKKLRKLSCQTQRKQNHRWKRSVLVLHKEHWIKLLQVVCEIRYVNG